jgi:WD repeat-containing protein 42A
MEATSVALLRRREREDGFAPSIGFHKAAIRGFRRTSLTKLRHRGCVNTASFSQNGCSLLTGSDDLSLKVWDVVSCALKGDVLTRHQHNIFAAAFCRHDSSQLLSGAADGTVRLSSLNSISTSDSPLLQSENIVHTLILDVESPHVVYVAEEAGYVSRIDMRSRGSQHIFWNKQRSRNSLSSQLRCVKALAQSNVLGSSQLFVGGFGFDVGVLDLRALPPENADVMADEVFTHSFSPLARSARTYPAISSWRSRSDSMLPVSNPMVSGLCLSEGGRSLLVNYQGDQIYAFDTPLAEYGEEHPIGARNCYGGHVNYNTFLKNVTYFGPRDEYVAAGSDQGALFIWAADSGRLLPSSAHYCTTHGLGSLSDEKLADRIACRLVNVLNADSSTCNGVAAHPFLPMLASYGIDSTAKLWSFKTDEDDNHTTSMRPSDRYIPFLESYGPESVMKRMPTILAQNLAGVGSNNHTIFKYHSQL